jgi:hypothetical protein
MGDFGAFALNRELASLDIQVVQRGNRDTSYSPAVFDLEAGPVTITLPDAGTVPFSLPFVWRWHLTTR